ncbi:hypothetical protein HanPSC8_Chr16g0703821 [Helianthus annuus]|nr:hypothetical protein HanPSC8_Chr16g0703821 [Helianthus annuus]
MSQARERVVRGTGPGHDKRRQQSRHDGGGGTFDSDSFTVRPPPPPVHSPDLWSDRLRLCFC